LFALFLFPTLQGGDGTDELFGGAGDDLLFGDGLNNPSNVSAAGGADFLDGRAWDDQLMRNGAVKLALTQ